MTLPLTATGQPRYEDGKFGEKLGAAPEVDLAAPQTVTLSEAEDIAAEVMDEHGLLDNGWTFQWDRATARHGLCNRTTRTISMSKPMTPHRTAHEVRQTMLHEVAHALTPGHKHDAVWLAKARSIGFTGGRQSEAPATFVRPVRASSQKQSITYAGVKLSIGDFMKYQGHTYTIVQFNRTRALTKREDGQQTLVPFSMLARYNA